MEHREISVDAIDPNPHRNFERNPIRVDQVEKIADSIGRTGFWDNIVVRVHPDNPGRYQLAYGHNRIDAVKAAGIKTVRVPVAPLSDWDMLCTMVDENETQQEVTPSIAYENILASVEQIERTFKTVGPKGTEEEFYQAMGKTCDVHRRTSQKDHSFTTIRNAYFAGEGLGKDFVMAHCPSAKLHGNTVSTVLSSHFGDLRAATTAKKAEEEEAKAQEANEAAEQATDEEEAERLRNEAEEAQTKADALKQEALRIGAGTIESSILLSFPNTKQMERFAAAVKSLGIPKSSHRKAAKFVRDEEVSGNKMAEVLDLWWYEASGQKRKDRERAQKEEAFRAFRRRVKDGDFKSYLLTLRETARKLSQDMKIAAPTAPYYEDQKFRDAACKDLKDLIEAANELFNGLAGEPIKIEATNGHVNQHALA